MKWENKALNYAYRKSLKNFVKNELLRYSGTINTLNTLIEAACKINNNWYKRNMKKKKKYNPNYKRIRKERNRKNHFKKYENLIKLDITQQKELLL